VPSAHVINILIKKFEEISLALKKSFRGKKVESVNQKISRLLGLLWNRVHNVLCGIMQLHLKSQTGIYDEFHTRT